MRMLAKVSVIRICTSIESVDKHCARLKQPQRTASVAVRAEMAYIVQSGGHGDLAERCARDVQRVALMTLHTIRLGSAWQ